MNKPLPTTALQPDYDPTAMSPAALVALSPYLVERPDEAMVLLGSRAGAPCGMTVHDLDDVIASGGAGIAETWAPLRPERLTTLLCSLDSGRANLAWEETFTHEFVDAIGMHWDGERSIWIYGDRRWLEGSLMWDDLWKLQDPPATEPVAARMTAIGLHARLEQAGAPRGTLPDFGRIPDGSHLPSRDLFALTENFTPDDDSERALMAERFSLSPGLLAGAIDHLLAETDAVRTLHWSEGMGTDGPGYRADQNGLALQALARWRWGMEVSTTDLYSTTTQPLSAHVRSLLGIGVSAAALGWRP
ncbi:hypothetical protein [Glycomyces sp. MUSA5-2]|uniref:hypothetical protein n=1 Tax=Glycomyces sp. MUSA5-2 TaxID=2053002 RepID=UPI0030080BC5